MNERNKWYDNVAVRHEILKAMKNREVILMHRLDNWKCIRGLFITSIKFLEFVFNYYKFYDKDYNIYVSCAKYKTIPRFPWDLENRSKETNQWFKKEAKRLTIGYDMLLDFDCKDEGFIKMKKQVQKTMLWLDSYDIRYRVYPSGSNFQIVIETNYFTDKQIKKLNKITKNIKERLSLSYLDLKGMGVHSKIRKCEYSLVGETVIFPCSSRKIRDIDNYSVDFNCQNILRSTKIQNRGLENQNVMGWKEDNLNNLFKEQFILEAKK